VDTFDRMVELALHYPTSPMVILLDSGSTWLVDSVLGCVGIFDNFVFSNFSFKLQCNLC